MNEKAWSLKFLIMAPQALKCFKDWIIEGYTKEVENPMESSLISATIFCNYPFDSTTLSDMILTLCSDWIRTSCLAAVKMLCVMGVWRCFSERQVSICPTVPDDLRSTH